MTDKELFIYSIRKVIELNIALCELDRQVYLSNGDEKTMKLIDDAISLNQKAFVEIENIEHIEILKAIYSDSVAMYRNLLFKPAHLVVDKKTQEYDKTEKGWKEFLKIQEEYQKNFDNKLKEMGGKKKSDA